MSDQTTHGLGWRLYHGETAFNFIGRRNRWFAISGIVILIGLLGLGVRGLNFGIDFKGGTSWEVPSNGVSVAAARDALRPLGQSDATIQTVSSAGHTDIRVSSKVSSQTQRDAVTGALAKLTKTTTDKVNVNFVGPTWGSDITSAAERALFFFLIAIFAFIWIRFSEWKMSVAAIAALVHDIVVTVGVYAVFGFPVTPATVIAFLTILGYSLYDTVVVFDKVDENTKGLAASGRMTYSDTVNLSMNQVLMRSLNTSLVAILPILSILIIGSVLLGATTLREFGLALFVGLLTGAYSSIFIASPLLAMLKEREHRYSAIRQRIEARGAAGALLTPAAAAAAAGGLRADERGDRGDRAVRAKGAKAGGSRTETLRPGSDRATGVVDDDFDEGDAEDDEPTEVVGARRPGGPAPRPAGARPLAQPRPRPTAGRPAARRGKKGKRR
jgi:preprotein translocase subunit SecF